MTVRVGAIVLAAGGSSRLGSPKQLFLYKGIPLVARAARSGLSAGADPVVVVLGADAEAVRAALGGIPVSPVLNRDWKRGMGSSLAIGVRAILEHAPSTGAVLITLADQPLVSAAALRRLIETWLHSASRSGDGSSSTIVAAAYADTVGVPAVFGRAHFEALGSLPDDAGAARLLRAADTLVQRVAIPEAAVDVDTPMDLERLRRSSMTTNNSTVGREL